MPTMRTIVIGVPQRLTQDQGSAVSRAIMVIGCHPKTMMHILTAEG